MLRRTFFEVSAFSQFLIDLLIQEELILENTTMGMLKTLIVFLTFPFCV